MCLAVLQGLLYALTDARFAERGLYLSVPVGAALAALACLWRADRFRLSLAVLFFLASAALCLARTGYGRGMAAPALLDLSVCFAVLATALVPALAVVFRGASPLKATLGAAVAAVALAASLAALGPGGRSAAQVEWSTGFCLPHPVLEHVYIPYSTARTYFPSNPRGYFDDESPLGRFDNRIWQLNVQTESGAAARATIGASAAVPTRAEIVTQGTGKSYEILLMANCPPLKADCRYSLAFRARADRPRTMLAVVSQDHPPYQYAGPPKEISLTAEWTSYRLDFDNMTSDDRARIQFEIGADSAAVELADVVWSSRDDPLEPHPNRRYSMAYDINSAGFRDRERSLEPPPGIFRIACLGDSFTFGEGVKAEDVYPARLEALLNEREITRGSKTRYEVLNFGVCGYSTRQERLQFELVASRYKPNLVLIAMVENDNLSPLEEKSLGIAADQIESHAPLTVDRLARWWRRIRAGSDFSICAKEVLQLNGGCRVAGADLAVILFHMDNGRWLNRLVTTMVSELEGTGIPLLDLGPVFAEKAAGRDLTVHPIDAHPNEQAHALAATAILEFLDENRLLPPNPR